MDGLSPSAVEVLGTLSACSWSGPHRAAALRRFTRLTPVDFAQALAELQTQGLVQFQDRDLFWITPPGEAFTRTLFC